jgi:hypothetical protein
MEKLRDDIEKLSKINHIYLASLLINKYKMEYDENCNGIFINMSKLPKECIAEIEDLIKTI